MTAQKKPTRNLALKVAIVQSGQTARRIALRAGIGEVRLSAFVRGALQPNDTEKRRIAKALRLDPEAVFPGDQPVVVTEDAQGAA